MKGQRGKGWYGVGERKVMTERKKKVEEGKRGEGKDMTNEGREEEE